ncbi:MAG: caspase family protein [Myxococcales bacterium]
MPFGAASAAAMLLMAAGFPGQHRFALVVGDDEGGAGTRPLRYAQRDAARIADILGRLGGVRPEDMRLLVDAGAAQVRKAFDELDAAAVAARARGEPTLLVVYYSGHSKDGELRLGDSRMPVAELRHRLAEAPAGVRIGLLDSCQSGLITRSKGVRLVPAFSVEKSRAEAAAPKGLVLIASSAADEESQESDDIDGSFFTHYLASGLLGDADANGDGRVTLAEAYAYAFGRTVGGTAATAAGPQHPSYLYDLGGAGDLVLTDLAPARGGLVFGPALEGVYVVLDRSRKAVAEVAKAGGEVRKLALPPGRYTLKKREEGFLLVGKVRVGDELVSVDDSSLKPVPLADDPQKGASGAEYALGLTGGYQSFFDSATRTGLFPPAALGGLELSVRHDLGHKLAWGVDLSIGEGSSSLALQNLPPLPVTFGEGNLGASLWRDFSVGPLVFALGIRVALIGLVRSFVGHPELPTQYFFTATPGVVGSVTWLLGAGWEVVARARANYLFYDVDQNESLGYYELSLGVAYAFSG